MPKYLLFFGDIYYPKGGFNDYKSEFKSIEDAQNELWEIIAKDYSSFLVEDSGHVITSNCWAHIFNIATCEIVFKLKKDHIVTEEMFDIGFDRELLR